jgi:hypothetical protein
MHALAHDFVTMACTGLGIGSVPKLKENMSFENAPEISMSNLTLFRYPYELGFSTLSFF